MRNTVGTVSPLSSYVTVEVMPRAVAAILQPRGNKQEQQAKKTIEKPATEPASCFQSSRVRTK